MDRRTFLGNAIASAAALTAVNVLPTASPAGLASSSPPQPKWNASPVFYINYRTITEVDWLLWRDEDERWVYPDVFDLLAHEYRRQWDWRCKNPIFESTREGWIKFMSSHGWNTVRSEYLPAENRWLVQFLRS